MVATSGIAILQLNPGGVSNGVPVDMERTTKATHLDILGREFGARHWSSDEPPGATSLVKEAAAEGDWLNTAVVHECVGTAAKGVGEEELEIDFSKTKALESRERSIVKGTVPDIIVKKEDP